MSFDKSGLDSYVDVASRMSQFFAKHPDGALQPVDPARPFEVKTIGDKAFVVYTAAAYRTPDDPRPGIGVAWEPFPGRTPYTRDSEVMNAETSAWGRAILAVGAADTRKGVASAEEVRNRQADRHAHPEPEARYNANDPAQIRRRMNSLFREAGIGDDRTARLEFASQVIGRQIDSSNELTPADVTAVIKALEAVTAEPKPEESE